MYSKELGSVRSFQRSDENAKRQKYFCCMQTVSAKISHGVLWGMFGIILKLVHSSNGIHM